MRKLLLLFILLFYRAAIAEQNSHLIYQGTSDTVLALRFIDTPNEKVEILKPLVRGELANQELITFANQIIQARETRNVNLYESLIHQEGLDHSEEILTTIIEKISDGSLMYGGHGYKYFVTSEPIADRLLNKIFRKNVNKPSITLTFYHYHPSNEALIGSQMHLIKTKEGYKSVLPVRGDEARHNKAPKPTQ